MCHSQWKKKAPTEFGPQMHIILGVIDKIPKHSYVAPGFIPDTTTTTENETFNLTEIITSYKTLSGIAQPNHQSFFSGT
jgi:hypothetical protein